jgi:Transposase DDE domain
MQSIHSTYRPSETAVQTTRTLIHDGSFCHRHRACDKNFTRRRKLTFMNVVVVLLQKTVRSIQLHLHDFFAALASGSQSVSASAWCEARLKLRHTAFIELNERAILDVVYGGQSDFAVRRWKGHRLIGIDSSLIRLPNQQALGEEFGWVQCSNQQGSSGRYPQARLSALTDLLNRIVIQTLFVPWQQGERDLALEHIKHLQPADIGLLDRGFASYELFAQFIAQQRQFVCRCPTSSFSVVNQLFQENQAGRSVAATLRPCAGKLAEVRRAGLPEEITVRFVTVRLQTGELEVLATNLLDEQRYPTEEFGELYHYRWGIETYYGLVKGRLDLENFTGLSAEAVRQDLYSTIFLSNLESILIVPAQEQLRQKSEPLQHRQQVNHAVSFHALKAQIIQLLVSAEPIPEVLLKLQRLFLDNPVSHRPGRKVPRQKQSAWRSYHYQRNTRKVVF